MHLKREVRISECFILLMLLTVKEFVLHSGITYHDCVELLVAVIHHHDCAN